MSRTQAILGLALTAVISVACSGGGGGGVGAPPPAALAGECAVSASGTLDGDPVEWSAVFILAQDGLQVTGTWTATQLPGGPESSGTFSGVIDIITQTMTFTMEQIAPCVPGTYSGSAVLTGSTSVAGTYTGSTCLGEVTAAFMVMQCQQQP